MTITFLIPAKFMQVTFSRSSPHPESFYSRHQPGHRIITKQPNPITITKSESLSKNTIPISNQPSLKYTPAPLPPHQWIAEQPPGVLTRYINRSPRSKRPEPLPRASRPWTIDAGEKRKSRRRLPHASFIEKRPPRGARQPSDRLGTREDTRAPGRSSQQPN